MALYLKCWGIGPDEDVWLQIVITPPGNKNGNRTLLMRCMILWVAVMQNSIFLIFNFKLPLQALDFIGEIIYPLWGDIKEEKRS